MPAGELIELKPQVPVSYEDAGAHFTANPDGTERVALYGAPNEQQSRLAAGGIADSPFTENLAARLTPSQRHRIAQLLCEYHETDLESRKDWEAMTKSALRLLGVEKVDVNRLPFPGAASVQHPVIAEACVQFNSNAIEEFFPPTGPVKGDPLGDVTTEIEDSAERAAQYMNYYLTAEDVGYYADKDQMLFYLPVAGSAFVKAWLDPRDQKPRARYIKAEDFVAPYFARDLENCPRYCHQYELTGQEIGKAMALGEMIELTLPQPPLTEEDENVGQKMADVADRRERHLHADDELYDILEYHIDLNLPAGVDEYDDGGLELPYIVTVDKTSREVLAIRRNWRRTDENRKKRVWFAHYKFLPGLGFYGWGFLHVIGSLADAVSGSVRAVLDSALMATLQGGFRAKDGAKKGGNIAIEPGKYKDIDASFEELSKTFYTPPFKEPSPALTQLFQSLVADARRFASITEVLVGQANNKAPVGTTLALIEQSMKLFTAVHKRLFAAAREEFRMLRELIHDFAPDVAYPYHMDGQNAQAMRADFGDHVSFAPVADPNIISDIQRIALAQAVLELVQQSPQLYGPEQQVEAHIRFLKALKVPDWQKLAPSLPQPTYMDPVGENQMMLTGRAVRAFPGQQHQAHNQVHQYALELASRTLPPDQFQHVYQVLSAHMREHDALLMSEQVSRNIQARAGVPLPPTDLYGPNQNLDPHVEMAISLLAAQNLPPLPPPLPGSQAATSGKAPPAQQAEQQLEAQRQKTEADIGSRSAEAQARIERDTASFVAEHKQRELEHEQRLRHIEEEHRARMRQIDEETASDILRRHAESVAQRSDRRLSHVSALSLDRQRHEQGMKHRQADHRESLLERKATRLAGTARRKSKAA